MASITESELVRQIKSGELSGAYYLYGTDLHGIERYKRQIVRAVVSKDEETYNLHCFDGRTANINDIAEVCDAFPMMADKICVTVEDLDLETRKLDKSSSELLNKMVKSVPDTTVLLFFTANADIYGGTRKLTQKNQRFVTLVEKHGNICAVMNKTKNECVKLICRAAAKRGCNMDNSAAEALWQRCNGNMHLIENEMEKLSAYVNGGTITADTVKMLTPETLDYKGYQLADAAAAGNAGLAMELFNELINEGNDPIYLLYILTGGMNDLYRARLAIDYGHSTAEAADDFGYNNGNRFRLNNAFSGARKYSAQRLRACMDTLTQADIDIKSGRGSGTVILETAIVKMLSSSR